MLLLEYSTYRRKTVVLMSGPRHLWNTDTLGQSSAIR